MKNGSHSVREAIFSVGRRRRTASAIAKRRSSVGSRSSRTSSSSDQEFDSRPIRSISNERTALRSDSSKVRPMAITSPVLFIDVPIRRSTVGNLSKGHRGIFVTT